MRAQDLPAIDARYWTAIVAASMAGANTGDFLARILGLGHARGLLPLAILFGLVLWGEARAKLPSEAWYWLAIIVLRTGATNLADLMTHDLALGYPLTLAALTVFLIAVVWLWPSGPSRAPNTRVQLPATDSGYWVAMLTAGTLGTAAGDFTADVVGLGVGGGSVVLLAILLVVLAAAVFIGGMTKPWYWATIVAARTAGTTLGDFTAGRHGLGLGLWLSTACTLSLLALILVLWRDWRARAAAL